MAINAIIYIYHFSEISYHISRLPRCYWYFYRTAVSEISYSDEMKESSTSRQKAVLKLMDNRWEKCAEPNNGRVTKSKITLLGICWSYSTVGCCFGLIDRFFFQNRIESNRIVLQDFCDRDQTTHTVFFPFSISKCKRHGTFEVALCVPIFLSE